MTYVNLYSIMIRHGGRWDSSGIPREFGIDGIMYDATIKNKGLVEAITKQLMIDTSSNNVEIRYIISDRCPIMIILNDTSVKVYLEQKKTIVDFFLKYSFYYLICVVEDSTWFLRSFRINKSKVFKIKKYCDIHTCSIKDQVYGRRQRMTKVVAGLIVGNYVDTKRIYTPNDIVSDMMREHGTSLDYHQAWRAKIKAVNMLRGDPTESYQKIPGYLYMLKKYYPGSVISWEKTEENRFLYSFVALDASIRRWEYCRSIIVVDGAALKSL
ncbi:hypothetical protein P3S67_004327 [Capsicum chacoense]